jgi:Uncharacterized protein containing a NRPS condensation (elongation) domain
MSGSKEEKAIKVEYIPDKWYRIDNSAVIYPMSVTPTTQSLFRLSAVMREPVDEELLASALKNILPRFPSFKVQIRSGLFRHFFDQNDHSPVVSRDNGVLFQKINFISNNHYLFRVNYFNNRISVDFFHALCDGYGALEFMKALVYRYISEAYDAPPPDGSVKLASERPEEGEREDGFIKYNRKYALLGGVIGKMAGKSAFQIRDKRFKALGYGLVEGGMKSSDLLSLAKKYGCTVTVLLAANALLSIAEKYGGQYAGEDLVIMIPVDLRKFFPSKTLTNFTTLVKCQINPAATPATLEAYTKMIKGRLDKELNEGALAEKLSLTNFMGLKWYMKILPLFLKSLIIRMGKFLSRKTKQTMILSNLGIARLPPGSEKFVQNITFNPNISRKVPINCGIISYNGVTTVSFTRMIISTDIEKRFFTRLVKEGLEVEIKSNLREVKRDIF